MGAAQVSGSSGDRASSGRSHACAGIGSRRGAGGACARDTVAGGASLPASGRDRPAPAAACPGGGAARNGTRGTLAGAGLGPRS